MKIDHLIADVVCIFVYFPILMWATWCWCWWWLWEIGKCLLSHTAPLPWPSPLTRVVSLDSLSPVLSLAVGYGSWQTPLSWSHHLSPHWTSLWARDSAQSSRARVTSSYSHCELSLPSAGDQISGLDHFVDGSEFRTRDLQKVVFVSLFESENNTAVFFLT